MEVCAFFRVACFPVSPAGDAEWLQETGNLPGQLELELGF